MLIPNRSNRSRTSHNSRTEKAFLGKEFPHRSFPFSPFTHLAFLSLYDAFPSLDFAFDACHAGLAKLCFHTGNVVKSAQLDFLHCSLWLPSLLHTVLCCHDHATFLPARLWGGALREDRKNGCGAD